MTGVETADLSIGSLRQAYARGELTPTDVVETHSARADDGPESVWISRRSPDRLRRRARDLEATADPTDVDWTDRPLYGIPFAVKDNIDHAGSPTTAGCPAYEYVPDDHATVVEKLLDAGAILVGKTNLDQFATGLVGTRSPYGETPNAIDPAYISGGSSAGSGVAVALGQVSFALGTDTAGSGRVPAALNGIVGVKPTRGLLSTDGVVPACKSLDCVAVFAATVRDALLVEGVAAGFDPADEYSRERADELPLAPGSVPEPLRVGVPRSEQLEFFGDDAAADCYEATVAWLDDRFSTQPIDLDPFISAGRLLYQGPWVAERLAAIQPLLSDHPDSLLPITREIITRGRDFDAVDAYNAEYKLRRLARRARANLSAVDVVVTPTTGTTYTREAVAAAPVETNSDLGYYTNFVNLLDLAAVAVPAGRRPTGQPFGVTLFADAFTDATLAAVAETYCRERNVRIGAGGDPYADVPTPAVAPDDD
jgi:allophanate hydrolase